MSSDPKSYSDNQHYIPPAALLLKTLGLTPADLKGASSVTVSAHGLQQLIGMLAVSGGFDPVWYAEAYPDVQGAVLAGDLPGLQEHYERSGYLEGRLPYELPCDPNYYFDRYADLHKQFDKSRPEELSRHYRSRGYFEGRAGVPEAFAEAEKWLHGKGA